MGRRVQGNLSIRVSMYICSLESHYITRLQICVPMLRNVFAESGDRGTLLLRCVLAYVKLDILASFDVHTEESITSGRRILNQFVKLANVRNLFSVRLLLTRSNGLGI